MLWKILEEKFFNVTGDKERFFQISQRRWDVRKACREFFFVQGDLGKFLIELKRKEFQKFSHPLTKIVGTSTAASFLKV